MKLWIARSESGRLLLFKNKPKRVEKKAVYDLGYFIDELDYALCGLEYDEFPEVTWENSPQEVELKLI